MSDDLDLIREAGVRTARYSTFDPAMGVPIRSSIGHPRFWPKTRELARCRAATPYGVFRNPKLADDLDAQRVAYCQRLHEQRDELVAELAEIVRQHPGKPLVVLCFEDVHAPGGDCHRTWFAAWFSDTFGIPVEEVSP